ncbi:MAG: DUF4097 family beta strand repeat-containing protein [Planctomycetota bacterium]|jgi:hypothetical protein
MRKELLIIVFIISFVFNTIQAESGNFKEIHHAKDLVKIEIDIGSLALTSNSSDAIGVECEFDLSGNTFYNPSVTVKNNYLMVEGEVEGSRSNRFRAKVNWIITVPHSTKVEFATSEGGVIIEKFKGEFVGYTGPGGIEISNCSGRFNFTTASGNIIVDDSKGVFELTSASGAVNVDDVILDDESKFSTRSGDIMVRLSETPDFDISISTTSGSAILDFNGNKVRGYFELSSIKGRDNIVCPFDFDDEWYVRMGGPGTSQKVIKAFTKESDTPFIEISGFPGGAILRN